MYTENEMLHDMDMSIIDKQEAEDKQEEEDKHGNPVDPIICSCCENLTMAEWVEKTKDWKHFKPYRLGNDRLEVGDLVYETFDKEVCRVVKKRLESCKFRHTRRMVYLFESEDGYQGWDYDNEFWVCLQLIGGE